LTIAHYKNNHKKSHQSHRRVHRFRHATKVGYPVSFGNGCFAFTVFAVTQLRLGDTGIEIGKRCGRLQFPLSDCCESPLLGKRVREVASEAAPSYSSAVTQRISDQKKQRLVDPTRRRSS
jgi:hypothetical protein